MGSLLSVSLSIDNFINPCCACTTSHLNHAFNLENNLRKLSNELDELKEMRNDVRAKIELAERQQMRPLEQVQGWLSRVEAMETEVGKLMQISTQGINRRCCFVCRPRNWRSVHKLGKKVSKKQGEIDSLKKKCAFNELVVRFPFTQVDERPSEVTVGMESIFEKVWGHLQEEVVVIGLYGLGGVGKTTLLTQINNKFANTSHNFDVVIWVVVSKDTDIAIIQKKIGEKIGFSGDNWIRKSTDDKSSDIYRVLSRKKFLLLLDDIWKPYDLLKIGVPLRTNQNKSKVVFTTRSEDVCGRMGAQTKVKVECLPWVEAWNLFRQNVGEEPLLCDPKIPVLAQVIAKECGGLPLALITIGRAMSCKKTHQEWLYAIQVLKNFAAEFSGMGDEVFPLLHLSYESLPNDTVKACFLYCSLFPEDSKIDKERLINYLIGEGIINEFDGAQNQGYEIIGILVHSCLLEEVSPNIVKIHDVLRDMALWIASEYGKMKNKFLVQVGNMLTEAPGVSQWEGTQRMSLMFNDIHELIGSPTCPTLMTLLLNGNRLSKISPDFFQFMPSLKVLDLSWNEDMNPFLLIICQLISLQYLDLSGTGIKELPVEFKELVNLRVLKLVCVPLVKIPAGVISSLTSLQVLYISCRYSIQVTGQGLLSNGGEPLVEELGCLKHLNYLRINLNTALAFEKSGLKLLDSMRELLLQVEEDVVYLNLSSLGHMKYLRAFSLCNSIGLEDMVIDWAVEGNEICLYKFIGYRSFDNLLYVCVVGCPRLRNLEWLIFAPSIVILEIQNCIMLEEVVGGGKWVEAAAKGRIPTPFVKLDHLTLVNLPQLNTVYPHSLPFPSLRHVVVSGCPELKKLPLNCNSGKGCGIVIRGSNKWFDELEWEDEATKKAFTLEQI